ncbi:MAG: hypothetical protein LBE34_00425 [Flavobacteriaceae bacterium]|jgi:hypothetical protein|nr:hypothetical protein [Flavobacteriaceae bacterium]
MKNNKHIGKYIAVLLLTFFGSISTVFAQTNKTVGTRITDVTTEKALKDNAILDLDSTTKGFFLPRMTTMQRDAIKKIAGKDNGLAIYNIDIDCVEYWSERTNKWMSVCGSLPPATLDLVVGACDKISFGGFTMTNTTPKKPILKQGDVLKPETNYISIKVKVEQVGTYTISATGDNGYFFSAEGQFQSTGTYDIIMKAMGTPTVGYDQSNGEKGDVLKFTINGKESTVCANVQTVVLPADLKFQIRSAIYKAKGKYNVNDAATVAKGNIVELDVDVENGGLATITAYNAILGVKFSGTKDLVSSTTDKIILEPVTGEAAALENNLASYDLTIAVNAKEASHAINGNKVLITIEQTEVEADNAGATFGTKPYYEGSTLDSTYKITVPVTVIGSGKTNLYLKGAGNVEFKAENVVLLMPKNAGEKQNVEFTAVGGTLPNASSLALTLSGDGQRFSVKNPSALTLAIGKKPVAYTIDCGNISSNRKTVIWDKPINDTYYIIVPVDVEVAGEYELKTTIPVQGMSFSTTVGGNKAVFTTTGKQNAILYPIDKTIVPTTKGETQTKITNADGNSKVLCDAPFKIKVGYPDLNVLYLAEEYYGYNSNMDQFITNQNRFGQTGTLVETGDVNVTRTALTMNDTDYIKQTYIDRRKKIADDIKAKKYNLILSDNALTLIHALDANIASALEDYITVQKGWFVGATNNIGGGYDYFEGMKREYGLFRFVSTGTWKVDQQFATANMFKRIAGGDLKLQNYYLSNVPAGFKKDTNRFTLLSGYPISNTKSILWVTSIAAVKLSGTNFEAIVTPKDNTPDEAIVFIHKQYNWVMFNNLDNGNNRALMSTMDFVGYDAKNAILSPWSYQGSDTFNGIKRQTGEYMSNFMKTVVTKIMNE